MTVAVQNAALAAKARWSTPTLVILAIIAWTSVMRFVVGASAPLWLDETWTAMVARQPNFGAFLHQAFSDTNAPLYYGVAGAFGLVAGYSDAALRLPAALFGAMTPLAILMLPLPGPRRVWLGWCAVSACWIPGIWYSQDARCYTLLVLFATMNTALFASLMESPSRRSLGQWAVASSLMILTHYYAGLLVAVQLAALLTFRRGSISAAWPGMLAFVPAALSMTISAPKFLLFSNSSVSWIPLVDAQVAITLLGHLVGGLIVLLILVAWLVICLVISTIASKRASPQELIPAPQSLVFASGASAVAFAIALVVGIFKPVIYANYVVPFAPGVLLGIVALATCCFRRPKLCLGILVGCYVVTTAGWGLIWKGGWPLEIETATEDIAAHRPERVVFLWDSEFMLRLARQSDNFDALRGLVGFFLHRAGQDPEILTPDVRPGNDPNPVLLRAAAGKRTAILWVYDPTLPGANGTLHPPRFGADWQCHNFGPVKLPTLACYRQRP